MNKELNKMAFDNLTPLCNQRHRYHVKVWQAWDEVSEKNE